MITALTMMLIAASSPIDQEQVDAFFADRGRVSTVVGVVAGAVVGTTAGIVAGQISGTNQTIVNGSTTRPLHESIATLPATWGLFAGVALGGGIGAAIGGEPIAAVALTTVAAPTAMLGGIALLYFIGAPVVFVGIGIGAIVGLLVAAFAGVEVGFIAGVGAVMVVGVAALVGLAAATADSSVTMLRPPAPRPVREPPSSVVPSSAPIAPRITDPVDVPVAPIDAPIDEVPPTDPADDAAP